MVARGGVGVGGGGSGREQDARVAAKRFDDSALSCVKGGEGAL
jgi:hypothetical protein